MDWRLWLIHIVLTSFTLQADAKESFEFKTQKLIINGHELVVEIADTQQLRQRGLMFRKKPLGSKKGMLFIFEKVEPRSFWMKNTFIPLSIGFFDKNKKLINVRKMVPTKSMMIQDDQLKRHTSLRPAKYALEVDLGWFEAHAIKSDMHFKLK